MHRCTRERFGWEPRGELRAAPATFWGADASKAALVLKHQLQTHFQGSKCFGVFSHCFREFFIALLGLWVAIRMAGPANDRSQVVLFQHPVYGAFGYFAPNFGLKCLLNLTYNQNSTICGLVQEFRMKLTFLCNSHVAGAATAPVAVLLLLGGAEFFPQLHYCYTRTAEDFPVM